MSRSSTCTRQMTALRAATQLRSVKTRTPLREDSMVKIIGYRRTSLTQLPIFDSLSGSLGLAPPRRGYPHDASKSSIERRFGIVADKIGRAHV